MRSTLAEDLYLVLGFYDAASGLVTHEADLNRLVAARGPQGWVLLNPVRLSERAESELLAKAPFRHAVRLGTYHGRDDRYYVDKFGVEFWGVPGEQTYPEPKFTREVTEDGSFPI